VRSRLRLNLQEADVCACMCAPQSRVAHLLYPLENKSRAALPRSAYGGGDIFALFERVDVESKYSRTKSRLLKLLLKFKKFVREREKQQEPRRSARQ
jgi:hypothetical protein